MISETRHAPRAGGKLVGTLTNWVQATVTRSMAERDKLRTADRALDLYTNEGMAHGLLESLVVEGVGVGFTPQPMPDFETLGFDRDWSGGFVRQALTLFSRWALDPRLYCDAQRRQNFYKLQAWAWFSWKLDGLGLFQLRFNDSPGRPSPLALLPIDPWRLATPLGMGRDNVADGVEFDVDGAPVAVWIKKPGRFGTTKDDFTRFAMYDDATGLPRFLLVCDVRNVAEYRQDSILAPMIKEIRDQADFTNAALVRAMIANLFVLFLTDESGVSDAVPLEERIKQLDAGLILQGMQGQQPTFFGHELRGNGLAEIMDVVVKRLGMATGRGPENVSREYKASYSASRASMEKADQFNDFEAVTLNAQFNTPVWSWLLYFAVLQNRLPVRNISHFQEFMYEYCRCDWLAQPKRQIDQTKAAKADADRLESQTTSLSRIYGEQGKNWKDELRQRAEELAYIQALEAEYNVDMRQTKEAAAQPQAETADDDEEEVTQ